LCVVRALRLATNRKRTALATRGSQRPVRTCGHSQAEEQASEAGLVVTSPGSRESMSVPAAASGCRQFGVVAYIGVQQLDDRAFRFSSRTDFHAQPCSCVSVQERSCPSIELPTQGSSRLPYSSEFSSRRGDGEGVNVIAQALVPPSASAQPVARPRRR